MKIEYYGISEIGNRKVNEDSFSCFEKDGRFMFVVADGLGGHGKGDVASRTAVESVHRVFGKAGISQADRITAAFRESQKAVLEKQEKTGSAGMMKTTMALVSIEDGIADWAHIGDSRIYCFRGHRYEWRTKDHSVPQMLVSIGDIKESEIRHHEDRNKILRVIGTEWDSKGFEYGNRPFRIRPNDRFVICSDGFWENMTHDDMLQCLRISRNATEWANNMKQKVLQKTYGKDSDNFTAVAVWVK